MKIIVYTSSMMEIILLSYHYIDDILLVGNNKEFVNIIKRLLASNFEMKGMKEVAYILGVKIYNDRFRRLLIMAPYPEVARNKQVLHCQS